jgi:hypothetical protein
VSPTIERNRAGAYVVSDIIDGHLVTRTYYGCTRREALAWFRQDVAR